MANSNQSGAEPIPLARRAALGNFSERFGDTSVTEVGELCILSIAVSEGEHAVVSAKLQSVADVAWPDIGTTTQNTDGNYQCLGLQQDQCFLLLHGCDDATAQTIQTEISSNAWLTDQSDSWACLAVNGPDAIAALERICPLNLNHTAMPTGAVSRTSMEHLSVIIQRTAADGFLLLSPSSSASSFLHAVVLSFRNTV